MFWFKGARFSATLAAVACAKYNSRPGSREGQPVRSGGGAQVSGGLAVFTIRGPYDTSPSYHEESGWLAAMQKLEVEKRLCLVRRLKPESQLC